SGEPRLSWPPTIRADLVYPDAAAADELARAWPQMAAQIEGTPLVHLIGLGGVTAHAKATAEGSHVRFEATIERRHLEAIARVVQLLMDQVRRRPGTAPIEPPPSAP